MSASYTTIADMQAVGWIVEIQSGSNYTATKVNADTPNSPMHIHATTSAGLGNAAGALRSHRENRSLHI